MSLAAFEDFVRVLSEPARPVPEMVELFKRQAPWESRDEKDRNVIDCTGMPVR